MRIKSFRDLRVWRAGMNLVEDVYRVTAKFPQSETFGLAVQMQRAAVSVLSNIAEGHTRAYTREYIHHVAIAHGSLAELHTQLEIAIKLGCIEERMAASLVDNVTSLGWQLAELRGALIGRLATPISTLHSPPSSDVQ